MYLRWLGPTSYMGSLAFHWAVTLVPDSMLSIVHPPQAWSNSHGWGEQWSADSTISHHTLLVRSLSRTFSALARNW